MEEKSKEHNGTGYFWYSHELIALNDYQKNAHTIVYKKSQYQKMFSFCIKCLPLDIFVIIECAQ